MIHPGYIEQVRLLLKLLPAVSPERDFFLKGGTAINFFLRDVPRLSVDIDLVYGTIADRTSSLRAISAGMERTAQRARSLIPGCRIQEKRMAGCLVSLYVNAGTATVTLEMNTILRGSAFQGQERDVSREVSERLGIDLYVTANTVSVADLYGGKICAALDRQHPRDLFDIKILFDHEGITDDIRKAFIVYLAGHDRPMSELLAPQRLDMRSVFESEFQGMTDIPITYGELVAARERLVTAIGQGLTNEERRFLVSMKAGEPEWRLLGLAGVERLPALQWKLLNVKKMARTKREEALAKLKTALGL